MKKRRFQNTSNPGQPEPPSPASHTAAPAATAPAATPSKKTARETDNEPLMRRAAVPALLFGVLGAFLFWADLHMMSQAGDLDARVHYPFTSVKEIDAMHVRAAVDPRLPLGESLYNRACAGCHQTDGGGGVAQNCPPLAGSDWVNVKDPSRLIRIVLKGASGPITVKGKVWSGGAMLPFEESFNDAEIASILSYIRNSWGNKNPLVDAADVTRVRGEIKDKRGYFSEAELLQVPLKP
jgi:mono/diheme cytochrome c family protein